MQNPTPHIPRVKHKKRLELNKGPRFPPPTTPFKARTASTTTTAHSHSPTTTCSILARRTKLKGMTGSETTKVLAPALHTLTTIRTHQQRHRRSTGRLLRHYLFAVPAAAPAPAPAPASAPAPLSETTTAGVRAPLAPGGIRPG